MSAQPPSRRKPLSQDRIVVAALRIVDRRGLDALTMRGVGNALGYEAMSLYKHVAGKQALVELVAERVASEIQPPEPIAPWADRLRHTAKEWRRVALAHPHVFPLLATGLPSSPAALGPVEVTLGALREAADDDETAIGHFWAFVAYMTGALLAECAATIGSGSPPLSVPEAIDPSDFPHLMELGPALDSCDFGVEYERGLEILIRAVQHPGS
ncbi:MAG: putative TetR family transcriptional regulator [Acidimicrobiales bacterium]|nr:putative TetR family transcriptional regulator [Acidimicrobiales bacterium]